MSSVLLLNRVYPPLEGATGQLLAELAPALVQSGWQVTVVTSGARATTRRSEVVNGVRVERVLGLPFTRANHLKRALSYLSLYPALLWRAARLPRHDIVVTLTDPPMQAVCGVILAALKKAKHVHWAQDIYPELAEEMGVLKKDGLIAGLLRRLSTWALKKADCIVVVGRCMRERLAARGLRLLKMLVIPNWGQSIVSSSVERSGRCLRQEQGWGNRFVVMYSGNFGLAHSFDAILDAAALMQTSTPQALFVFVGDGPRLPWVRQQVSERGLANIQFLAFQPKEKLTEVLSSADVHLACMRSELCGLVVPSKVYGIIAAARPCVFLGPEDSEAARLVRELDGGTVLSTVTGDLLARCLSHWAAEPELLARTREKLRAVGAGVGVERAAQSFDELLSKLLSNGLAAHLSSASAAPERAAGTGAVQPAVPGATVCRWADTNLSKEREKQNAA